MAGILSFRCASCGQIHEGSPSFSFDGPSSYFNQTQEIRDAGELGTDFCWYRDEDGEHCFIRVCLEVPIHGVDDPFMWGVWVSVSKENFERYYNTFENSDENDRYFGWLMNILPFYEDTYALKTEVRPRAGGTRPYIVLEPSDHPLSVDYHKGISVEKTREIAEIVMHKWIFVILDINIPI